MLTMTKRQFAKEIQRSQSTLTRLNSEKLIPAPLRLRGGLLWRRSDVILWIELGMPNRADFEAAKTERAAV